MLLPRKWIPESDIPEIHSLSHDLPLSEKKVKEDICKLIVLCYKMLGRINYCSNSWGSEKLLENLMENLLQLTPEGNIFSFIAHWFYSSDLQRSGWLKMKTGKYFLSRCWNFRRFNLQGLQVGLQPHQHLWLLLDLPLEGGKSARLHRNQGWAILIPLHSDRTFWVHGIWWTKFGSNGTCRSRYRTLQAVVPEREK